MPPTRRAAEKTVPAADQAAPDPPAAPDIAPPPAPGTATGSAAAPLTPPIDPHRPADDQGVTQPAAPPGGVLIDRAANLPDGARLVDGAGADVEPTLEGLFTAGPPPATYLIATRQVFAVKPVPNTRIATTVMLLAAGRVMSRPDADALLARLRHPAHGRRQT